MPAVSSVSTGHGRRACRTIKALLVPAWIEFDGAAQVAQVRRTVTKKGVCGDRSSPARRSVRYMPRRRCVPARRPRRMFCACGLTYVYYFSRHSYSAISRLGLPAAITFGDISRKRHAHVSLNYCTACSRLITASNIRI